MNFEYETSRLILRILHPNYASMVLDFYENNKEFLEPFEPARQENFYTLDFQRANLSQEYSSFFNSSYLRIWLFEKENPNVPIGTVCFSNFLHGAFCNCMMGYKMHHEYTRKGYIFKGWNTKANGKGIAVADGATISQLSAKNKSTVTKLVCQIKISHSRT